MIFASLIAKLGFDTSAWSAGANRAKSDMQSLKAKNEDLEKSLKNTFGRKSTINEVSEILTGGGAVAGIVLLGATVWKLAEAWSGAAKAAEEAAEAQKRVADQAELIRKTTEQRDKALADSKESLLSRQRETENLSHQKGLDRDRTTLFNDKLNAQDDIDKKLRDAEKTVTDARAEAARLQKEQEAIKKQQGELSKGFSGEKTKSQKVAAGIDAFAQRQSKADLDKALKENEDKLREAAEKAKILESSINQIRENARQEKLQIDQQYSLKDQEVQREANDKFYKDAAEAEKKKMDLAKDASDARRERLTTSLEDDRDKLKQKIEFEQKGSEASMRRAEVASIRGGSAGIVLEKEADPNTPIFKEQLKQLGQIEKGIQSLKSKVGEENYVAVNF